MWRLAVIPFLSHALLMLVDEVLHLRRGLGTWERWGHPLDTLSVLICYVLAVRLPLTAAGAYAYAGAAVFSCLLVTKDEWVHARDCSGAECWLHACLFVLHPVVLALVGAWAFAPIWIAYGPTGSDGSAAGGREFFGGFLTLQVGLTLLFGMWQLLFWNGPWRPALRPAHA